MGFLRVNFWSRDFLRFCCFMVLIFAPIRPSPSLEKQELVKEEFSQLLKNFNGQHLAGFDSHNHKLQLIAMFLYITW